MPSPIFAALFIKKYIVQTRANFDKPWRDYDSYRNLSDAEQMAAKLARQNPQSQVRIFNRLTQQAMPAPKK